MRRIDPASVMRPRDPQHRAPGELLSMRGFGRCRSTAIAFAGMSLLAGPVVAASTMPTAPLANVQLSDPTQEAQAKALMETLRCLVCQGQSIADSNADLAADMRSLVRQRIQAGEAPEAVRAWLINRYGNWVSYKPALAADTALLWIAPALLLALGGVVALGSLKRRRR